MASDKARLKVIMVGPKTFPPVIGGIETHVYELSRRLAMRGHNVSVIIPRPRGNTAVETIEGVRVVRVRAVGNRYALKLSMIPWVIEQLRSQGDSIVHAHDATGGFAAAFASDRRKFVYTMHGLGFHRSDWPTPFRQGIRMMQARALSTAAHVFCTDQLAAEAASRYRKQLEVLSSGIDVAAYTGPIGDRPPQYRGDAFTVLYVGRLAKVKGLETYLEAIGSIPEGERKRMRFVVIGDGPLARDVEKAAQLIREISLVGAVEHSKIAPYFRHADAFVLPSLSEGLPMSLLEAMASGVPVIATDVGGVSKQMDRSALRLVPPGDSKALAQAIRDLGSNRIKAAELGRMGREMVSKEFTWDRVVQRIEDTYRRISAL